MRYIIASHQPSGERYALRQDSKTGIINAVIGPLYHGDLSGCARNGDQEYLPWGNANPEDNEWANNQRWRECTDMDAYQTVDTDDNQQAEEALWGEGGTLGQI